MKFKIKKSAGFSLVEMIVVIAIIAILTAVVLPNYKTGGDQLALQRSASKLAQGIRGAQEMTMVMKEDSSLSVPLEYYGVYLLLDSDWYGIYSHGGSETVQKNISLGKNIKIKNIIDKNGGSCSASSLTSAEIKFFPPNPDTLMYLNCSVAPTSLEIDGPIEITLSLISDETSVKKIIVNQAGLIYVE